MKLKELFYKKKKQDIQQYTEATESVCQTIEQIINFYYDICSKTNKDEYNLILHRHIGDSYVLLCLKNIFEKEYGKNIHFFVKPRQEMLMKMFNIDNYTVVNPYQFFNISDYSAINDYGIRKFADSIEEDIFIKLFCSIPILGEPFICAPVNFIKNKHNYRTFVHGWSTMLGLDIDSIKPPELNLMISEELQEFIEKNDADKVICIAPEANSCETISKRFWNMLVEKLLKKGYTVIANAVNDENIPKGAIKSNFSLYDFIVLSKLSNATFTIRSGLADIVATVAKKCYVFSTEEIFKDYFYMNKNYELPHEIYEIRLHSKIGKYEANKIVKNIMRNFNNV